MSELLTLKNIALRQNWSKSADCSCSEGESTRGNLKREKKSSAIQIKH